MKTAAERAREVRRRRRQDRLLVKLEVPRDLRDRLVDRGFLAEWDENDPGAVQDALQVAVEALIVTT